MGSAAFERDVLVVDEAVEGVAALLALLYAHFLTIFS